MSLKEITLEESAAAIEGGTFSRTNILVPQVLQQLQLPICSLGKHGSAKGLHDLLDGNILVGKLISRRAGGRGQSQPRAPRRRGLWIAGFVRTRPNQRRPCQRAVDQSTSR